MKKGCLLSRQVFGERVAAGMAGLIRFLTPFVSDAFLFYSIIFGRLFQLEKGTLKITCNVHLPLALTTEYHPSQVCKQREELVILRFQIDVSTFKLIIFLLTDHTIMIQSSLQHCVSARNKHTIFTHAQCAKAGMKNEF